MGIRGEIEKLETYRHRILNYEYETINKADVFSILDEWELVAEITGEDWLCPSSPDPLDQIDIIPGDEVAIYVRRRKEDER